jgi:IMP dehydrogenase
MRRNHVAEVEIGIGKSGRRAYGFDDIAIVPSRRTRDPDDIDISWDLDAYHFELPLLASAMDGVVSPRTAIEMGKLGGLAVLNLEGLWSRYEDPEEIYNEIARLPDAEATKYMQDVYRAPMRAELISKRVAEIKASGVITAASLTPQRVGAYHEAALEAGLDILVIQGTVVSAEHVSTTSEPLNLKSFIARYDIPVIVGGCASYSTALHLMRTGAAGVLVGVGPGAACTTRGVLGIGVPQATALADAAGARLRHLEETGSPLARAVEAPGQGFHWGMATFHPDLPRGTRVKTSVLGTLKEILLGPAPRNDGTMNLFGALRTSMATTGYQNLKEFQKAEVMVAPALQTEGKALQRAQHVGMG